MNSLGIKEALELQKFVLGEPKEVRNCRFDSVKDDNDNNGIITKSAGQQQTVKYEGITTISVQKQLELQRLVIGD